jgi:hypothetical protein
MLIQFYLLHLTRLVLSRVVTVDQAGAGAYSIFQDIESVCDSRMLRKLSCICFNSKDSLLALSSYTISSSLVSQCWHSLHEHSTSNIVRLYWVPDKLVLFGKFKGAGNSSSLSTCTGPIVQFRYFDMEYFRFRDSDINVDIEQLHLKKISDHFFLKKYKNLNK